MNDKQILDRLESINLSLRQKKDLIDIIKDIAGNNSSNDNGSNNNGSLDNDFIIVEYAANTNTDNFDIYINNKLCELHHYDHYSENEYEIIDEELFNLFNTFKRILIYIHFDDVFIMKTTSGYNLGYINSSSEQFMLSFGVITDDNTFNLHITKKIS